MNHFRYSLATLVVIGALSITTTHCINKDYVMKSSAIEWTNGEHDKQKYDIEQILSEYLQPNQITEAMQPKGIVPIEKIQRSRPCQELTNLPTFPFKK